jgi:predicted GH43/DUF377 family glycosyl hydrolase
MNPILPLEHCVPDGEPRVMPDGRLYLYGSYDICGDDFYCSQEYHSFSSDDLVNWTHHGMSFRREDSHCDEWSRLYAPDCMHRDGTYYLTYCGPGGAEGIATADTPYGPFRNGFPVEGADGDAIDPTILLDGDGQVYLYWGQFKLRGARLNEDLHSIDKSTLQTSMLNEKEHGFHEGPSIRKRGDWYYMVYCDTARGKASCLSYAMSRSPLGPFEKKGVIIDNDHCDPETWNNHGGMAEFNGRWYICYHRSSQNSKYSRRACMESIAFNDDGTIDEMAMTTQGVEGPLNPRRRIEATRFCLMNGGLHVGVHGRTEYNDRHREFVQKIHARDWMAYKFFDFPADLRRFTVRAGSLGFGGTIELHLDSPDGPLIGTCNVTPTGGWQLWQTFTCPVAVGKPGVHALYLLFQGLGSNRLMDVECFWFE